jgi:hypothetical protein
MLMRMSDKPEVGFGFGVEGDQSVLATIKALRDELKNVKHQQEETASSAEVLRRGWDGLRRAAELFALAEFAKEVFDTAVSLGKLNQITGVSTQTLSVYYKAAKDVGIAHETVDKGLTKLSRSFVQLAAGNSQAAMGFGLLHLKAKDFIGLSPDEKLRKVTDAIARMKDGAEKAAASQALLGRGGAQLIPAFNQLGGEEFEKIREQAERLGLIFDGNLVQAALRARAALEDVKGTAEGLVAQFETGLLPGLADAADGIVAFSTASEEGTKKSESGFKSFGEGVGWILKRLVLGLAIVATAARDILYTIGTILEVTVREYLGYVSTFGTTLGKLAHGDFEGAWSAIKQGGTNAAQTVKDAWRDVAKTVGDSNAKIMALFNESFPAEAKDRKITKPAGEPGDVRGGELDRSGRGELSGLKQRAQDELALYRALSQQKNEQDRRAYEDGLISLDEYFNRRAVTIRLGFVEEVKALGAEKLGLQGLLERTEAQGAKTPQQEATKQREILGIKQQIAHVDSQLGLEAIKRDTEEEKNETERARAKQEHLLKELEAEKKLADIEGDRAKAAQLANQIEDLQVRKTLAQLGHTKEEIDKFLAEFGAARGVRTGAADAEQGFSGEHSNFEQRKAAIEAQAAAGPLAGGIAQYQAEKQLRDLYAQEIPILERKLQALRLLAAQSQQGSALQAELNKKINEEAATIEKLRLEATKLSKTWKVEVQQAVAQTSQTITHGLNGWMQGHEKFGSAVKNMWNSIVMTAVNAIENIAAKWIEQHILMAAIAKITKFLGLDDDANNNNSKKAAKASGAIQMDAAQASADVFLQAIEGIPFPANLAAAPALAAATNAEVQAFNAQALAGAGAGGAGFAAGGYVARKSFIGGGAVSGPSGTDVIPAWLTAGEHVITKSGVNNVGVGTLDAINQGKFRGAFLPPIRQPAPYTSNGFQRYAPSALAGIQTAAAGGGGKSITVEMQNHLSSLDSASFRDRIDDHMDYIADGIKERMRDFRF